MAIDIKASAGPAIASRNVAAPLCRDYNCDSTIRYDYDPTTTYRSRLLSFDAIRREQKN